MLLASLFLCMGAWAQLTTGQYYKIKNVTADLYLQVAGDNANMQLRKEAGTVLQLFQLEEAENGQYYIKSVKGETTYYAHASGWNFNATTTAENKTPYTIALVEGETNVYSLNQTTSNYTGYAGADATDVASVVYCNKGVNQNGKWLFEAVDAPSAVTLETGKNYRLRSDVSGLYMQCVNFTQTTGEGAFQLKGKSTEDGQIFQLEDANEGKYYLKTVKEETTYYVKAESWNFYASTEATTPFTIAVAEDEYSLFSLKQETAAYTGYAGNTNNGATAAEGTYLYNNQPNLTGNTVWFFEEVADEVVNITYVYKYGEKEISRETIEAIKGAEFPAITVPFGFTATKPAGEVTAAGEYIVSLTENLPFEYSSDVASITNWYFVRMHPSYPSYIRENEGVLPYVNGNSVATDDTRNSYAWGFVGDPVNGFKVVNKATGNALIATGNNDDDVTTGTFENGTVLSVCASTERTAAGFFTLKPANGGSYLNANAPAGRLKHWSDPDGGSTIQLFDYTPDPEVTFNWTADGYETLWGTALAVADYPAVAVNTGANGNAVHCTTVEITTTGARTIETMYKYSSGACALQILGVDIINANGDVVSADYHVGSTGNNSTNNTYTTKVAEAGTYSVRCYVWTNDNERLSDTNGTVTISFSEVGNGEFAHDVTFAAEYATLYLGYKAEVPEGVEAYVVSEVGDWAVLTEVENVIPAATPVVLKKVGVETTYTFAYTNEDAATVGTNLLQGSIADKYIADDAYVLANGSKGVGLYKATKNQLENTAFKNNANKAYLVVEGANAPMFSFNRGEGTTSIDKAQLTMDNVVIYDLLGRRVEKMEKGIYIVNGKKIIK